MHKHLGAPLQYLMTAFLESISILKKISSIAWYLLLGLRQICQHNKKQNRPEYYAGIMLEC